MNANPAANATSLEGIEPEPLTRRQLIWKYGRWVLAGLGLLVFFTFWKLPDAKIKQLVVSEISRAAYEQAGIELQPRATSLSWIFGPTLRMTQVSAQMKTGPAITLDGIKVSPSLLSFFIGRMAASISIWKGKSEIDISVHQSSSGFGLSLDADLPTLDFVGAKGQLDLSVKVSGKPNKPQTFDGGANLNVSKLEIPEQDLQFLKLPSVKISTGKAKFKIEQGVAKIEELTLGKEGDDLILKGQGEATLATYIEQSNLNLKGTLKISPRVASSLPLLEALLGPGKQADGSYAFRLSGSPSSPFFSPGS